MTASRCPCGHDLDADGAPDEYMCLNGRIYGPCGSDVCNGVCDDTYGFCDADGCLCEEDE